MKLITLDTLRKWNACPEGAKRFLELFPGGATLKDASEGLITDGNANYSNWLWEKSHHDDEYIEQTIVFAGYHGTAKAGDYGTATAGDYGSATAGDYGSATAGDYGTATAGYRGTATAGYRGTATAGEYGLYCNQKPQLSISAHLRPG